MPNPVDAATTASTYPMTIKTAGTMPAGTEVYLVAYGQNASGYVYYDWDNGDWKPVTDGVSLPSHNYKTTATGAPETIITIDVPELSGARVYVSYGKAVDFKGNVGNGVSTPNPWKASDPMHKSMVDKIEFTTSNNSGLYDLSINTTCVDFFGIPLSYKVSGYAGATTKSPSVTFEEGITATRAEIYNDINSDPIFRKLLQRPDGGGADSYYRILAPGTSIVKDVDNFPNNFFDSYIDYCWTKVFTTEAGAPYIELENINPLHVPVGVPTIMYRGSMKNNNGVDQLVFTASAGNPTDGFTPVAEVVVDRPTTLQVMTGTIDATATPIGNGNAGDATSAKGFVTAQLSAAICRTNLHVMDASGKCTTSTQWADFNNFYKQDVAPFENDPANGYANDLYSQVLHNHSINHRCYSSPYSDQYGWSAFSAVFNPTTWEVTLGY